jgi:cytochrome c
MFRLRIILCAWLFSSTVFAQDFDSLLVNASPEKGKLIAQSCNACHALDQSQEAKFGPSLYGVVGRQVASVEGYDYSSALVGYGGAWDFARLNEFLAAPMQVVPGTKMAYPGVATSGERAAVIAWLRLQADQPVDLPVVSQTAAMSVSVSEEIPAEMQLMPEGEGRETVFYLCNSCHSVKLVVQQGMNRSSWKETLEWMVEEQGMDEMDEATSERVLNYLAKHVGIDSRK